MSSTSKRRGAPIGNINALKHGFYTRLIKKHDLSGVESTDTKNLVEEIAIVRVFTRRLIESLDSDADTYEIAGALKILCVALSTITRAIKTHHWLTLNNGEMDDEISIAIKRLHEEINARQTLLNEIDTISNSNNTSSEAMPSIVSSENP